MKFLKFILPILIFHSCNNVEPKEQTARSVNYSQAATQQSLKTITEQSVKEIQEESIDHEINTSIIGAEKFKSQPHIYKHLTKLKTITSYPDFVRKFFMRGSSSKDVLNVEGEPDSKVKLTNEKEAWYYGNCEVIVNSGKVEKVRNDDDCLMFCDIHALQDTGEETLMQLSYSIIISNALKTSPNE